MEVSGKKVRKDNERCKPCNERKLTIYASGFCAQCSEYMCHTCFDTHKQFKLNREHRLLNTCEERSEENKFEEFDICDRHTKELIKFYCPQHDEVGCGDCMILDHKPCKVELILDMVNDYKDSETFSRLTTDVEKKSLEAKTMLTSIRTNKDQIIDVNKMFKHDVNTFKDTLIAHITRLANGILKIGDDIMEADMKLIETLETETGSLITRTTDVSETFQLLSIQPYKLFISSVSQRKNIKEIQHQLERIKGKNTINTYVFDSNTGLAGLVNECQQLGNITRNQQKVSTEIPVCQVIANVMAYDDITRKWIRIGLKPGFSMVQIFRHTVNNTFRVVGRKLEDHEVVINLSIYKTMLYYQATPTFHHLKDGRQAYGFYFANEKDTELFAGAMLKALYTLNNQGK